MDRDPDLLASIYADPEADAPRLVYADVLAERGDPRGEMIHVQCALARLDPDDKRAKTMRKRESELLEQHERAWLPRAPGAVQFSLHRGFVEGLAGEAREVVRTFVAWRTKLPLLSRFDVESARHGQDPSEGVDAYFARSDVLPAARWLRLSGHETKRRARLAALRDTKPCPMLRSLAFDGVGLLRDDVEALVAAPCFSALREIVLSMCRVGKDALAPLANAAMPLTKIVLSACHAGPSLGFALATAPAFSKLEQLVIPSNNIGDEAFDALARSGRLRDAFVLDLQSNNLGERALVSWLASAELPRVRKLLLGGNHVGDAGATAIAQWRSAAKLETLNLGFGKVSDDGALALARSPYLTNLRSLVLTFAKLKPATERALLDSPTLANARIYVGRRFLSRG